MFWFKDVPSLLKVLIAGIVSYVFLILFLRISGKRTLSQLNIFDFVITIAFGSTMASTILDRNVPIANGLAALGLLVLMQFVVASSSFHWSRFRRWVKSAPRLLYFKGQYIATPCAASESSKTRSCRRCAAAVSVRWNR